MSNRIKSGSAGVWQWVISAVVTLLIGLSTLTSVDSYAAQEYDKLFQRAFVTFALARTLNGVISVVQGTEVALTPAGVGVTLTPGQILDPVNDLVERFSWIMLGATVSLGVQHVLLDVGQWWPVKLLVAVVGGLWLWLRLVGPPRVSSERIVLRVFIVTLFLRFAVPVALIANELLFELFLAPRYAQSTQVIEAAGTEIEQVGAQPLAETDGSDDETGLMDSIQRALHQTKQSLDLNYRLELIKGKASDVMEHIVQLIVVFILQTALLPVAFLWLFLQIFKSLLRARKSV